MKKKKKLRVEHKIIIENAYEIIDRLSEAELQVFHDVAMLVHIAEEEFDDINLAEIRTDDYYVKGFNLIIKNVAEDFKMKEEELGWSVCTIDSCAELILIKCFYAEIEDHFNVDDGLTCKQKLEYGLDKLGDTLSGVELYIV